eukprot:CAMPEP_0174863586 /NCGR_PEP_ID=MMETSP1114-20130205/56505_1 /TAXON_ID=312471 /ORGANISM="Neobodo designis, Strain CCAP 1951/1" /LENGTH=318 /DNA_ID=CAMNT_0016098657 /DNA_START=63 /DNA_END=1019 /DNA_ORIENTATION=-
MSTAEDSNKSAAPADPAPAAHEDATPAPEESASPSPAKPEDDDAAAAADDDDNNSATNKGDDGDDDDAEESEGFSKKEVRYFRKMFDMFDTDHSGAIGFFEMKNLTKHLGVEMDDDALRESMAKIDENGNGDLEFDEFLMWLSQASNQADEFAVLKSKIRAQGTRPLSNAQIERLREVFNHFDADNSGSIDIEELGHVFEAMGQKLSEEDLAALMKQADDDGSGEMEFEEFLMLMCSNFGVNHAFDQDLIESFHAHDPLKTGVISCADLSLLIRELVGPHLTTDEIDEVIDVAHTRGDGYVEYHKWDSLWEACRSIAF